MAENLKDMFCQPRYERALLGYCIKSLDNFYDLSSRITDKDFLRSDHRLIFMLLSALERRGTTSFDGNLIVNEAEKHGILSEIGGYEYVNALVGFSLEEFDIDYYTRMVLDSSTKYRVHLLVDTHKSKIEDAAIDDTKSGNELLYSLEGALLQLSSDVKSISEPRNMSDGLDDYIEDRQNNPIEFCGLTTGFDIFDKRIDGLTPKSLTVICARPKDGKSTFLMSAGMHVAYTLLLPVLYIDTEMSFGEVRPRMLSVLSGVPEIRIKHGGYSPQERRNIDKAVRIIKSGKFFHEYCPGYTVDKVRTLFKKYKHRENIGLGIFDYIKSPESSDFSNKKEYQIIGDVTTALKDMAGVLDIPVLCANQLNKEGDVADSDRVRRYADIIAFLKPKTRDEVENGGINAGNYKLIITASRRGGTTPDEGIGIRFIKSSLQLTEAVEQVVDFTNYANKEKEEIAYGFGDDNDEQRDTESEISAVADF